MMGFTRDRLVEFFFWNVGFAFKPKFWFCRKWIVKFGELITIIDDMYELHGTLEELVLFTDMIDRFVSQYHDAIIAKQTTHNAYE